MLLWPVKIVVWSAKGAVWVGKSALKSLKITMEILAKLGRLTRRGIQLSKIVTRWLVKKRRRLFSKHA